MEYTKEEKKRLKKDKRCSFKLNGWGQKYCGDVGKGRYHYSVEDKKWSFESYPPSKFPFCEEHLNFKCSMCGKQATRQCGWACDNYVCNCAFCDKCDCPKHGKL